MAFERDLFANFERMRREIDDLFGDVVETAPSRRGFSPRVDVYYCGDPPKAIVIAELAGIDPQGVGIEIQGRRLLLAGERRSRDRESRLYQQIEIEQGRFARAVELGADVEAEAAKASYENGFLRVEIPLQPAPRARRVPISDPAPAVNAGFPPSSEDGSS